jgi:hypothetical protein
MATMVLQGGIRIQLARNRSSNWGGAVEALTEALKAEGLIVVAQTLDNVTDNAIHIQIGTKE